MDDDLVTSQIATTIQLLHKTQVKQQILKDASNKLTEWREGTPYSLENCSAVKQLLRTSPNPPLYCVASSNGAAGKYAGLGSTFTSKNRLPQPDWQARTAALNMASNTPSPVSSQINHHTTRSRLAANPSYNISTAAIATTLQSPLTKPANLLVPQRMNSLLVQPTEPVTSSPTAAVAQVQAIRAPTETFQLTNHAYSSSHVLPKSVSYLEKQILLKQTRELLLVKHQEQSQRLNSMSSATSQEESYFSNYDEDDNRQQHLTNTASFDGIVASAPVMIQSSYDDKPKPKAPANSPTGIPRKGQKRTHGNAESANFTGALEKKAGPSNFSDSHVQAPPNSPSVLVHTPDDFAMNDIPLDWMDAETRSTNGMEQTDDDSDTEYKRAKMDFD